MLPQPPRVVPLGARVVKHMCLWEMFLTQTTAGTRCIDPAVPCPAGYIHPAVPCFPIVSGIHCGIVRIGPSSRTQIPLLSSLSFLSVVILTPQPPKEGGEEVETATGIRVGDEQLELPGSDEDDM